MAGPAQPTAGAQDAPRNVRRLRPVRVLLAFRDRRFMRVTTFLLERRGYDVVQDGGLNIAETAARSRADVVVFDADASRASAARLVAALEALPAPPGLLAIVSHSGSQPLPGVPGLRKWAPMDELASEIDAASLRRGIVPIPQSSESG